MPGQLFEHSWLIAALFSLAACVCSLWLIYRHLRNYTASRLQRYIVRILFMVPVRTEVGGCHSAKKKTARNTQIYATTSWLSLRFLDEAIYFNLFRDSYEAYVIWCFFNLLEKLTQ